MDMRHKILGREIQQLDDGERECIDGVLCPKAGRLQYGLVRVYFWRFPVFFPF